jgi:DNA-binding LacI/PurR family transcriptional regulator
MGSVIKKALEINLGNIMENKMTTFIYPEEIRKDAVFSKYYQIYSQLKKEIFFGKHKEGDRFFSNRDLQKKYAVNKKTIHTAVEMLTNDGFVTNKPMSGIYVNSSKKRRSDISMGNIWFCQLTGGRNYPFYSNILAALQRRADMMGMNVIVNHGTDVSDLERWFKPETGDGLVVSGDIDASVIRWLKNTPRLRYVVVGNYDLPPSMPNVHIKVAEAVYRAMELSAESGRRKVAVITNPYAKVAAREIMDGIGKAEAKGLIKKVGEVLDPLEDGYAGMLKLRDSGCDSILVAETAFFGVCRYVFEHRIKCPEDLCIIRYGKNKEDDIYGDVAAINITSDKMILAEKIMSTLFGGGPVHSELDCDVIKIFPDAGKINKEVMA